MESIYKYIEVAKLPVYKVLDITAPDKTYIHIAEVDDYIRYLESSHADKIYLSEIIVTTTELKKSDLSKIEQVIQDARTVGAIISDDACRNTVSHAYGLYIDYISRVLPYDGVTTFVRYYHHHNNCLVCYKSEIDISKIHAVEQDILELLREGTAELQHR